MRTLILTAAWLSGLLWAQTILVDGTGDGSFEGGTGCAGNDYTVDGWTIVNGNQTNRWAVNTDAGATHGSQAIYITNNCGDSPLRIFTLYQMQPPSYTSIGISRCQRASRT